MQIVKRYDRTPLIHIHYVERTVAGQGIAIKVYGEMLIAAKEYVYARELKLNTLEVLLLTPEGADHLPVIAKKWIYHKGELDNYASIDLFDHNGTELIAGQGRSDGSTWLNFLAMGE